MEALGGAASIMQVLQISEQIVSACYQYYRSARSAKKDIIQVINIVGGLKSTLENLQLLIGDPVDPRLSHLACLDEPLKSCQCALTTVATKLRIDPTKPPNAREVKVNLGTHLTWPWKEKEIEKILSVIEKQKTIFILALGGDTLLTTLSIQDTVEGVRSSVDAVVTSQRHSKILDWIKLADPSSNHNAARKKHQATTGKWFLESEQFIAWKEGSIASIWVHGIPGAGKTILSSTVINHIDAICNSAPGHRYAYFYFDFNDANKRTVNGMLRSLIHQLSIVSLPAEVETLYRRCGDGSREPGQGLLVDTLISLFQHSDRTFVIVDALDECSERADLFDVIAKITQAQRIGLLATSRNERDIARSLQRTVQNITSLQEGDGIAGDISLHVHRCLQEDIRLSEWPGKIREEIQEALVNGAHGMFRWVECQLDALRKCLTVSAVRYALRNLPCTLDETYDRVLHTIPVEYRREAHCALQLLTVSIAPLTLIEVAEAVAVDCEKERFDPDDRLREPEALLEICSGLLTLSGDELRFAHYSVQEYLVSPRLSKGRSSDFVIVETRAHRLCAHVSLKYLVSVVENYPSLVEAFTDRSVSASKDYVCSAFPFLRHAMKRWSYHLRSSEIENADSPDWALAKRLFDPDLHRIYMKIYISIRDLDLDMFIFVNSERIRHNAKCLRLYHASLLGLAELVEWLLREGEDPNRATIASYGYPIIAAANSGHDKVLLLLLNSGAQADVKVTPSGTTALMYAAMVGRTETMKLLLNGGAFVNEQDIMNRTALHFAARRGELEAIHLLLNNGADVNVNSGIYGCPLHSAATGGNPAAVSLLLQNGADINQEGGEFGYALQNAAAFGRLEVARFLVETGANVNAQGGAFGDALQATCSGWAYIDPKGYMATAQLLLDHGANVNAKGGSWGSPLKAARQNKNDNMIQLLLEHGARD